MLLLGIDLGTSFVKGSVIDGTTGECLASASYPGQEADIISKQKGWAEQSPLSWWECVQHVILKLNISGKYDPLAIGAIGISYQMHGLVTLDKNHSPLRDGIIWCDSRAVEIGAEAFEAIGEDRCLERLLNSPGNFTASKLGWVKENEPKVYESIDKVMLPGDYIALMLTGEATTTTSALSEGMFWDFVDHSISFDVLEHFEFSTSLFPSVRPVFSEHGKLRGSVAEKMGMKAGVPVTYKAGDQLNNALALGVMEPGEIAATAGTSGVVYRVNDQLAADEFSRVNSFAHVNHMRDQPVIGELLCINGAGILNKWMRKEIANGMSYDGINLMAASIPECSEGLFVLPFGNGQERMLIDDNIGAHICRMDFNRHTRAHILRAAQEGVAFAFRYGIDMMQKNGERGGNVHANRGNLFLSEIFLNAFVESTGMSVELHDEDGATGAAIGAGMGCGFYKDRRDFPAKKNTSTIVHPSGNARHEEAYEEWKHLLEIHLLTTNQPIVI